MAGIAGLAQFTFSHPAKPPPNHRFRRRRPSPRTISPSSGLSSILATFAASSLTVDGSPLTSNPTPPLFLCPVIEYGDNISPSSLVGIHVPCNPSGSVHPSSSSKLTHILSERGTIPDKYQQGPDGIWYKVEEYTLYGSTICSHCEPSYTTSSSTQSSTAISTPSTVMPDILDQLPTGWKPPTRNAQSRTTLILALSLALAFFICFFMTGCIIWRKNKLRASRRKDEEMRMRKLRRHDEQRESDALGEREAKVNRDLWARATARWKANARHMARQRRCNRRYSRHTSLHRSSISFDPLDNMSTPPSPVPSRSASRGPPLSVHESSPRSSISLPNPASHSTQNPITPIPPTNSTFLSPPAYHPRAIQTSPWMPKSPECIYTSHEPPFETPQTPLPSRVPAVLGGIPIQYPPSFYTAHVATDDKATIAQMASLASAPPVDSLATDTSVPLDAQASVPIWKDEELEDYTELSCPGSNGEKCPPHHSPESPFPPPPSQGNAAADPLYDYVYSHEDLDMAEREIGPSAPPFEEGCPNVPLFDIIPSAPPLLEDERHNELNSSAPDGDGEAPDSGAQVPYQEADCINTCEQQLSCTNNSPSAVPVACDSALPCYHA